MSMWHKNKCQNMGWKLCLMFVMYSTFYVHPVFCEMMMMMMMMTLSLSMNALVTLKLLKIRTPEKYAVIILKFDSYGFSIE